MDTSKKEQDPKPESKLPSKAFVLSVFLAFAFGAFVKGEVSSKENQLGSDECRISIQGNTAEGKLSTDIHAEGSQEVCASFMSALQAQNQADDADSAPDGQAGQATDDQSDDDAACSASEASAPVGASQ